MALPQPFRFRPPCRRRLYAGVALVAYLLAAGGIPIPAAPARPRHGQFPCQDHDCGCSCAEECWAHCCCFSPEERARWAQAHGMEIPPALRPALVAGNHCRACAHLEHAGCELACGQAPAADAVDRRPERSAGADGQVLIHALSCRGLSTLWMTTGAVLPPPPPVAWPPCRDTGEILGQANESAFLFLAEPPFHPPRAGA